VVEDDVLIFRPESVYLGDHVYVGHLAILKAYPEGLLVIGDGCWLGEQTYINSAGAVTLGRDVGVGVGVKIISSVHLEEGRQVPILHSGLRLAPVVIGDYCDLGVGAIILPGVTLGRGVQVGAGAVVSHDLADYAVAAGVPARVIRTRSADGDRTGAPGDGGDHDQEG
jgi:acetyltransferase-like isoleucine patch superfamily enzyme